MAPATRLRIVYPRDLVFSALTGHSDKKAERACHGFYSAWARNTWIDAHATRTGRIIFKRPFPATGCGFFEEGEFAWQPRRDWIWPGAGKSAKVLVSWMAQMAGSQWGQAIPTKLSGAQFEQFVLPHLSRGTRGPASKLSPHAIFNYILKLLYLGRQWKELPIEKDRDGRPEIHHTRIYRAFRRWEAQGCIAAIFAGSVLKLHQAELLDISIIHGDGTTTAAKKGGDNIGFSGHKKMKGDKVVAFCDRNCNVIAPFVAAPGNDNESPLLREALPLVTRIAREIGMNLQGTVV